MTKLTETQNRILAVSTIEAKTLGYIAAKLDMTTNKVRIQAHKLADKGLLKIVKDISIGGEKLVGVRLANEKAIVRPSFDKLILSTKWV